MCNKPYCVYASTDEGKVIYCSFYAQGAILLPKQCSIPFLSDDDDVVELTDEVK